MYWHDLVLDHLCQSYNGVNELLAVSGARCSMSHAWNARNSKASSVSKCFVAVTLEKRFLLSDVTSRKMYCIEMNPMRSISGFYMEPDHSRPTSFYVQLCSNHTFFLNSTDFFSFFFYQKQIHVCFTLCEKLMKCLFFLKIFWISKCFHQFLFFLISMTLYLYDNFVQIECSLFLFTP